MSTASRSFDIAVADNTPSWWAGLTDKTWTKIAAGANFAGSNFQKGNRLSDAWAAPSILSGSACNADGSRPNIFAYSGGVVNPDTGDFIMWGGGHGAYPGNEPYANHIRSNTPAWRSLCNPSPGVYSQGGAYDSRNSGGQYTADVGINGAPVPCHTYSHLVWANGKMWLCGMGGMGFGVQNNSRIFSFDPYTGKWKAHHHGLTTAQAAGLNIGFKENMGSCYVASQNAIWIGYYGAYLTKFSVATEMVVATYTSPQTNGWWNTTGQLNIPGTEYIVMFGNGPGGAGMFIWDAANPTASANPTKLTVTDNAYSSGWQGMTWGYVWHDDSGAILASNGMSANLVKIAPNTPGAYTGAWTATTVSPDASNTVTPTQSYNYTYGRFNLIKDVVAGRDALVFHPDTANGPTYLYKIPAAGV